MSRPVSVPVAGSPAAPVSGYTAPLPVHPHLSVPSWSSLGQQLRTLLLRSPLVTAGILAVGAGAVMVSYAASQRERRARIERRRVQRQVKTHFNKYRLDIIKYITEQPWNRFNFTQLEKIYSIFASMLEDPRRGVLPLSALTTIIRKGAGVGNERVAHACAKFFDLDGNFSVDFVEFVERLNLLVHGSKLKKLEALFSVYDLDGSGKITRSELEEVVKSLGNKDDASASEAVQRLFAKADRNHDGAITQADFLQLAEDGGIGALQTHQAVQQHFGLLH